MTSWTATVDWRQHVEPENTDDVLDQLIDYSPAIGLAHLEGIVANPYACSITITLEAATLRQATTAALQVVEQATDCRARGIEVLETAEFDRRQQQPSVPELVGYAEIADMAGVSRQRARQYTEISGFPVAVVETQSGPLRVRSSVEAWLERRGTPKPGRPAKPSIQA